MNEQESLRRVLHSVVPSSPHALSEEELWARSRRRRARRHGATAVGSVTAVVAAGAIVLSLGSSPTTPPPTMPAATPTTPPVTGAPTEPPSSPVAFSSRSLLIQCIRDSHYQVDEDDDGTWTIYGTGRPEEAQRITDACAAGLHAPLSVLDQEAGAGTTRTEAGQIYADYLSLAGCLEERNVPVSGPPSRAEFVDQLSNGDGLMWHPYAEAAAGERLKDAMVACPLPDPDLETAP